MTDSYQPGQYEFLQRVAYASSYEIWRALDLQHQRMVLVTVLHLRTGVDGQIPRFLDEAHSLSTLDHPGLAKVLTVQFSRPPSGVALPYTDASIVTENVDGLSLTDYLVETAYQGNFPTLADLYKIVAPICSALDHAHQHGVIHGCLRPDYIIFPQQDNNSWYGTSVLTGFGLHIVQTLDRLGLEDAYYITPELARGQAENIRSDFYSLGLMLYELCTGSRPFQGTTVEEVVQQQLEVTPLSPIHSNPHLLPGLVPIIFRCLAKEPAARFPSGAALLSALHTLHQQSNRQSRPLSRPNTTPQGPRSNSSSDANSNLSPLLTPSGDPPTLLSSLSDPLMPSPNSTLAQRPAPVSPSDATKKQQVANSSPMNVPPPPVMEQTRNASVPSQLQATQPASPAQDIAISQMARQLASSIGVPNTALTPQLVTPTPQMPLPGQLELPTTRRRGSLNKRIVTVGLPILVCLCLCSAGLLAFFSSQRHGASAVQSYGSVFFTSSGLLNHDNTMGLLDGVEIDVRNLPAPPAGKQYYAWLLHTSDTASASFPPVGLGALTVTHGRANVSFQDSDQSNLLAHYSRFLVTAEDSSSIPQNPSLDASAQRFSSAFSNVPNPDDKVNHFSLLNHLQHLLVQDPTLKTAGIQGGLSINLYRSMTQVMAWSGSARDAEISGDYALALRQSARVLAYLEGKTFASRENLPNGLHPDQMVDQTAEKVPLITIGDGQGGESYFQHIGFHLREIAHSVNVTAAQKNLASTINNELNNANEQLLLAYKDASAITHMTEAQLHDSRNNALTLLSDMFTYVNNAFSGQVLAGTTQISGGVSQIFYDLQRLPTFEVQPCSSNGICA